MIKRQSARLSSVILSDYRPRQHCGGGLMAAASSLIIGKNDPLLLSSSSKPNFNPNTITARFQFLSSLSSVNVDSLRQKQINWRCIDGLKGCHCSNNHNNNNSNSTNNNITNALHKARAFAPCLPHLIRDPDKIGLEEDNCAGEAKLFNNGAYHRGSSLGYPDQPEKIIVAVDVDEVLGNFVSALNRFIADRYSSSHSVSEYHVYEFFKIWNCSREEADIRVHEFFKTSHFKTGIHPIPGAHQALQKLSRFCNLSVVTSRQNAIKDHTIEWIEKHYPGLFQEIHFGNHFALDGQSRPKSDICRSLGARVLIDDNPRYAIECADVGIRVLLFDYENSYPWCKIASVTQHPLVTKVHNWGEVERQLVSRVFS